VSFDHFELSPELLRAVADQGYETPTPVQEQAIPLVLQGRDLLAAAQTGTGKTAAFVLPILQLLHTTSPREPSGASLPGRLTFDRPDPRDRHHPPRPAAVRQPIRVLVLVPTRELALQVEESTRTYGAHRPVRSTTIYGGVGFEPQVRALRAGPGIVVATPGRLLDHVEQRTIDLSRVEILVLDEADRMLDMGFIQPIRRILALLPRDRQNLLFSATFSDDVRRLAGGILNDPASVEVAPRNTAAELVDQLVIRVDRERKRELLSHLILSRRIDQALVFTRTKHGANRLAEQLDRDGVAATAIHGNKSQAQRVRALTDFKAGRSLVLVATDIAARGIDIDALPHVVNFELPMVASDYVHRIGRTGRAGVDGQAISLVCVDEAPLLRDIETLLRRSIPSEVVAGFEPDRSIRPEPIRLRTAVPVRPIGHRSGVPGRPNAFRPGGPMRPARPLGSRPEVRPGVTAGRPDGVGLGNQPRSMPAGPGRGPRRSSGPHTQHGWHGQPGPSDGRPSALPGERFARAVGSGRGDRPKG
jgi:ATP-dependent RNA helicase RhlE